MGHVPGQVIGGYQLLAQAPASYSGPGALEGHHGWWSDPWWGYSRQEGFALLRHWKPKYPHMASERDHADPWHDQEGDPPYCTLHQRRMDWLGLTSEWNCRGACTVPAIMNRELRSPAEQIMAGLARLAEETAR